MREYSKRLGPISPEQFQAALSRLRLGEYVKAEPVAFGLFGQNVFLTSSHGEYVFRGAPHYSWQFRTEQFFANMLHQHTLAPVPYPYLVEPAGGIFAWEFVVMPRLPGLQLQDESIASQLTPDDRLEIARALARMLVEVQTLTWECAGKYDPETERVMPFDKHYREWVVDSIRAKVAAARSYNEHTTASDVEWIESIVTGAAPVLQLAYQPCVVLGDFGEHNALVMRSGGEWRVSGLFDLMTAHFGDGQADLSLQVTVYLAKCKPLADAFVAEYLRLKPPQPGFVEHQRLYMLDLKLSFWRHWQRNTGGIPGQDASLRFEQWARPSVEYWNDWSRHQEHELNRA